jgi:hypothetical protein
LLSTGSPQIKELVKVNAETAVAAVSTETRLEGVCKAFHEHLGLKAVCKDLLIQVLSPEEAKCKALQLPHCTGFTFEGGPTEHRITVYFKSDWETMTKDTMTVSGYSSTNWTSYRMTEEACTAGDSVKAVFPPNGKRYGAVVSSFGLDQSITVNWLDGGKTHRVLDPRQVTKDHRCQPAVQRQMQPMQAVEAPGDHSFGWEADDALADANVDVPELPACATRSRETLEETQSSIQAPLTTKTVGEGVGWKASGASKRKEKSFCCC